MRILVIEDEPRILEFLRLGLEAEGFRVDAADDGAAGLGLALAEPYELVVLDLLLPRLDGFHVLGELRRARPEIPVLILSARSDLPTKLRSFGLGANDYLSKPFSFGESWGPTAATVCNVRSTLWACAAAGTSYGVGPLVRKPM
jgi:two-component system copper resistance phosphate regulon response regulator CusR